MLHILPLQIKDEKLSVLSGCVRRRPHTGPTMTSLVCLNMEGEASWGEVPTRFFGTDTGRSVTDTIITASGATNTTLLVIISATW